MPDDVYKNLGKKVRSWRAKYGWTQEELGYRAGLHPSFVGQIERGTKKISLVTLQKLAKALKLNAGDLLNEKPITYNRSAIENKIAGAVNEQSLDRKKFIWEIIKNLTRLQGRQ